jgi:hypothetical protein
MKTMHSSHQQLQMKRQKSTSQQLQMKRQKRAKSLRPHSPYPPEQLALDMKSPVQFIESVNGEFSVTAQSKGGMLPDVCCLLSAGAVCCLLSARQLSTVCCLMFAEADFVDLLP